MKNAQKQLFYLKDMNKVNPQEHAYCQLKLRSNREHVSHNIPVGEEEFELLPRSECNVNLKLNTASQSSKDFNNITKIIYPESKDKTERNTYRDSCFPDTNKGFNVTENANAKNNNTVIWSSTANIFGKRKLHKSYMISWGTQISCNGFARCLIETCNFISLDLQTMQEHYKTCDGMQNHNYNLCPSCNSWLSSENELIIHKSKCKNKIKSPVQPSRKRINSDNIHTNDNEIGDELRHSVNCRISSVEDKVQISSKGTKYCDQCDQDFFSDTDYSLHLALCKSNSCRKSLPFKKKRDPTMCATKTTKEKVNEEDKETCIIQPGRNIPRGEYVRRRAYTKQHKAAWEAAIQKYKHVKCIFQNCHFLALSVEDMISHYGYCNGDGSFAKFACPFCGGRVTDEKFLEIHIRRSHAFEHYDVINNYFLDVKMPNEEVRASPEGKESEIVEVKEQQVRTDREGKEAKVSSNTSPRKEPCRVQQNSDQRRERCSESACESSDDNINGGTNRTGEDEESNLPKEQNTEFPENGSPQRTQTSPKNNREKDYKDDHIYFKRKTRVSGDSNLKDSLLVMKNKNLRHYSGPKNVQNLQGKGVETIVENEKEEITTVDNEEESPSNKTDSDNAGSYVRQMIKFSFPTTQNAVRREIQPSYTSSWTESIKTNGFARCLVATCNFISLDIFHIENHFKTCNGVPENGPNLCTFCDSRLPSAIELWIHTSMCRANGDVNASLSNIPRISEEYQKGLIPEESDKIGENKNSMEVLNFKDISENESKSREEADSDPVTNKNNKTPAPMAMYQKKEKMNSLRISDIVKLRDNGTMDYSRIIQPGPVLPEGQYIRRRSYTKTHKAVWEAALEKHKYVKCIFQNCHFLAMSLEDMIYHFGYCIGDGSFAKFECPHCGGRLTNKIVLDIHIQVSHSDKASVENEKNLLTGDEDKGEILFYSLDDWKKLITKKEIKTYGKQSRIVGSKSSEAVAIEDPLETSEDDCSSRDASHSQDKRDEVQDTVAEVEGKNENAADNLISNLANNQGAHSGAENDRDVSDKSSNIQGDRDSCEESGNDTNEGKERVLQTTEQSLIKTRDESDNFKDKCGDAESTVNICNGENNGKDNCEERDKRLEKNQEDQEMDIEENENAFSLLGNDSEKQSEETEIEKEKNSKWKSSNKETESRRKRGRSSKCLIEENNSKRNHDREVVDNSDAGGTGDEADEGGRSEEHNEKLRKKETPNQPARRRGRPPKRQIPAEKETEKEIPEPAKRGRRGRKRKDEDQGDDETREDNTEAADDVKCAKCGFKSKRQQFSDHNFRKHVGLSWIEGENPIDLNEESTVSWNVKQAFKYVKSATCGNCGSVKKSALGFISHIQNCGKSEEEKDALKVSCPRCPARILKYSLPMHLKLSHPDTPSEGKNSGSTSEQPSKRKSAIRAVNKFHEVLKQYDEEDDGKNKAQYMLYEKGTSKFPKLPHKIRGLWNKMIKEKKKIPCRRGSCLIESGSIREARNHHFLCSELPDKSYVCQLCDYYSSTESSIQQHVNIHPKMDGDFTVGSEDERLEEEVEMKELEEESDFGQAKSKIPCGSSDENALETAYKSRFFERERLLNERQTRFCRRSLRMTLETEMGELKENCSIWRELHTKSADWIPVSAENSINHLPGLEESMSFRVNSNASKSSECDWKKLKRFGGEIIQDSAVIFTGGSVLSMSWCKYSCVRSSKTNSKQYLAISSSRKMEKFQNIHQECGDYSGLIQIYCCGEMKNFKKVEEVPEMVLGIVHNSGQVWDLSWFPSDCFQESENEEVLTRIGLLGAACQDGTVRIWPICDPGQLKSEFSLPLYRIDPSIILELEDKSGVGCLRLALGRTGIVIGGYANGVVAVWSLRSTSSPFCKKMGNSFVLKPHLSFQAHRTSITALSICQNDDRYISSSGLDRFVKFWDLECPGNPFEIIQKGVCLDNVWPRHWPLTISAFEDIVPCSGKGVIKAIRDVYCDKHRTPLAIENTCWSLSFNEWLNVLCGCNNTGEVKIRYLRNMFLADEKFRLRTGHIFCGTELKLLKDVGKENLDEETRKGNNKKKPKDNLAPRTYEEASHYFGLIFNDYAIEDDSKPKTTSGKTVKKDGQSVEEYPIASVNKVCWNPNYNRFMQLAMGHHCGIVRIRPMNDAKCDEEVLRFLKEAEEKISKLRKESN